MKKYPEQQKPKSFLSSFCCGSKYSKKKLQNNQQQQQKDSPQRQLGEQQRQTHQTGTSVRQTVVIHEEEDDQFEEESKNCYYENKNVQNIQNSVSRQQKQEIAREQRVQVPQVSAHKDNKSSVSSNKSNQFYTMSNELFTLKTKYSIHQIDVNNFTRIFHIPNYSFYKHVDVRPTDKEFSSYFTFDCPICFRHFNKILKSACCDHYLCHHCLRDIYIKGNENENFDYRCMFCQKQLPEYIDADDHPDQIKKYFDSPFVTPKGTNTRGGNTVVPFLVDQNSHNIHNCSNNNNLINFQEEEEQDDHDVNKENNRTESNQRNHNIENNCNNKELLSHLPNIIPPPAPSLPHILKNILQSQDGNQRVEVKQSQKDKNYHKNYSQGNEDIHSSEHNNSEDSLPEFQNKYHCVYLKHSNSVGGQIADQRELNDVQSIQIKQIKYVR